jgi:putative sigma-54 modulation protein
MNIQITARKFKAKESLKEFIKDELKTLEKYADEILDVNVILSFEHMKDSIKIAEVVVKIPGKTLTATEATDDFPKSVSACVEKLIAQLKKHKSKIIESKRGEKPEFVETTNETEEE